MILDLAVKDNNIYIHIYLSNYILNSVYIYIYIYIYIHFNSHQTLYLLMCQGINQQKPGQKLIKYRNMI